MQKTLSSLMDNVSLINALLSKPNLDVKAQQRLARSCRHLDIMLDKPEIINSGISLTTYTTALEKATAYLEEKAPSLLG